MRRLTWKRTLLLLRTIDLGEHLAADAIENVLTRCSTVPRHNFACFCSYLANPGGTWYSQLRIFLPNCALLTFSAFGMVHYFGLPISGPRAFGLPSPFSTSSQHRRQFLSFEIFFCISALGETGPETIFKIAIETLDIMGWVGSGFLLVVRYRDTIAFPSFFLGHQRLVDTAWMTNGQMGHVA